MFVVFLSLLSCGNPQKAAFPMAASSDAGVGDDSSEGAQLLR